ncbi:MAG: M1 family metallopeptidase, partial [Fidelibacterota bacterium]
MQKIILPLLITISFLLGENQYFQQEVAYHISVTLDDSAHTLTAFEKLVYMNHSPDTLDYLWFHLWPNAYKNDETAFAKQMIANNSTRFHYSKEEKRGFIDSLDFRINGEQLKWEFHPEWIDVAKVYLPSALPPEGVVTIETPFFVKLPEVFSRLGHSGKHYEITQWYPKPAVYDSDGWHPMPYLNMGEFYSEFGTFDVEITLPKEYRIMATGDIVNGESEIAWLDSLALEGDSLHELDKKAFKKKIKELKSGGKSTDKFSLKSIFGKEKEDRSEQEYKTVHFHQENVHDFAWFADKKWIVRKGELWLADSTHKVTLWSMYLPKNAELWEKSIEYCHDAGYWYSRFYGDYPYNHISAVDGDLSAGGGMEYPNITVISSGGTKDLLEFVIMHEVGHNWFYGIL